jgi:hypothetical protein
MTYVDGIFYSSPVTRTLSGEQTGSGKRIVTTTYKTSVNPTEASAGNLKSSSSSETVITGEVKTGSGRNATSHGEVGTYTYKNDGTSKFTPTNNFSSLPSDVRNVVSTDGDTAKKAINSKAAKDGFTNGLSTASNAAPGAEGGGGGAPSNTNSTQAAGRGKAPGGGGYRYPATMKSEQDHLVFTREEGESVVLAIPAGIQDSNSASWGESRLDAIKLGAAKASMNIAKSGDQIGNQVKAELEKGKKGLNNMLSNPATKNFAAAMFAEKALGMGAGELSGRDAFGGAILNPNLELIFNGPTLREFSFTFRMTPRDQDESKQIKGIINFFKSNMVPRSESIFLKRPYYFDIKYSGKGASGINQIKRKCALKSCSVQYTPDGSYMTYQDGTMTAYSMSLQFTETTPLTSEDYINVSDDKITF